MLAAVTSGNRKTWQILLPAFQFGSNITGMICRGGFLRLFIHQGFRNGSRRQNLCKKSQNGTFPLKFACMLEKESGFQGEQPPSCVPPASDQGGSTAGRPSRCPSSGTGFPPLHRLQVLIGPVHHPGDRFCLCVQICPRVGLFYG